MGSAPGILGGLISGLQSAASDFSSTMSGKKNVASSEMTDGKSSFAGTLSEALTQENEAAQPKKETGKTLAETIQGMIASVIPALEQPAQEVKPNGTDAVGLAEQGADDVTTATELPLEAVAAPTGETETTSTEGLSANEQREGVTDKTESTSRWQEAFTQAVENQAENVAEEAESSASKGVEKAAEKRADAPGQSHSPAEVVLMAGASEQAIAQVSANMAGRVSNTSPEDFSENVASETLNSKENNGSALQGKTTDEAGLSVQADGQQQDPTGHLEETLSNNAPDEFGNVLDKSLATSEADIKNDPGKAPTSIETPGGNSATRNTEGLAKGLQSHDELKAAIQATEAHAEKQADAVNAKASETERAQAVKALEAVLKEAPESATPALQQVLEKLETKPAGKNLGVSAPDSLVKAPTSEATVFDDTVLSSESAAAGQVSNQPSNQSGSEPGTFSGELASDVANSKVSDISASTGVSVQSQGQGISHAQAKQSADGLYLPKADGLVDQVVEGATLTVGQGRQELAIQLKPEGLGSLRIQLVSVGNDRVNARLIASTPEVQDMLQDHLSSLRTSLESKGVHVDRLSVVVAGGAEAAAHANSSGSQGSSQNNASHNGQQQPSSDLSQQMGQGQYQQAGQAFASLLNNSGGNGNLWQQASQGNHVENMDMSALAGNLTDNDTHGVNENGNISLLV